MPTLLSKTFHRFKI